MLALDCTDRRSVIPRRNEEDRVLTAVLSFAKDFNGSAKHDLTYL